MKRHPWLHNFNVNYGGLGPSQKFAREKLGQSVIDVVLSETGFTALIGAIDAAPKRPPHPAFDRYLLEAIGLPALEEQVRILCGRLVRQAIEHVGGHHVRTGVPVNVASIFANGSIYSLPTTNHGKFDAAARHAWAVSVLAAAKPLAA